VVDGWRRWCAAKESARAAARAAARGML